jgi:transcriptional regulator with GAF, ATPase, and Fis domain
VLQDVECAAASDAKVLITGESGAGKEVVARMIHLRSRRSRGPLVTINCAGVPDTLLASELFGHVRGSFTDAYTNKRGLLEQGDGGTVFLDEVGEMSLQMQALLLRFLESGEIQRLGSERSRLFVDVRIITATNRRLLERVAAKEFRDDLFYRLNVFHIDVPPLRDRLDDVPLLAEFFLKHFSQHYNVAMPLFDADAMACLSKYQWPGNVRELRNVLERLVVRGNAGPITRAALPREILASSSSSEAGAPQPVRSRADVLFEQMVIGRENFWKVVGEPFLARDLTRDDLRTIVRRGLELTNGSYKALLPEFNMAQDDYKKFLGFLRKYQAHLPIQTLRPAQALLSDESRRTDRAVGS